MLLAYTLDMTSLMVCPEKDFKNKFLLGIETHSSNPSEGGEGRQWPVNL